MRAIRTHSSVTLLDLSPEMPRVKRKLTTVLCADARGYAGQMQADETGTLDRLRRYRSIMDELFARHDGRIVNTWGDSIIAEFGSVVEAVRCAVEIQEAISTENAMLADERQMHFRIGINLGDVIQDSGDIYGEGVNAAARLESLAEPGGIMVSETVQALTHKQLNITYDFVGSKQVKGAEAPVSGYRVRMSGDAPISAPAIDARLSGNVSQVGILGRYHALPATVRLPLAMIAVFFIINLVTGIRDPWFIYPAMPFLALIAFRLLRGPKW